MLRIFKPLLCLLVFSSACLATTIINGGFETGSLGWTVASTNFGTPWCDALCGTGAGTAGPHSGMSWLWFGGTPDEEHGRASQSVVVSSAGSPSLSFWLRSGMVPAGATDYFLVMVDGNEVFRINQLNAASYSSYSQVSISLGTWADDASHLIEFEEWNAAGQTFNLSVDDVSVSDSSAPEPGSALMLGAGALLLAAFRRARSA
jgi:hypothetical protein